MENLKFNYKKCLDWINAIADNFSVTVDNDNYVRQGNNFINLLKRVNVKERLFETLLELKDTSLQKSDSEFYKMIGEQNEFWKATQFRVISSINRQIDILEGTEKQEMEDSKDKHMIFFHYNYNLLNMIKSDIINDYQSSISEKKVQENKKIPKSKTLNDYRLKYQFIEHQIEIVWSKENHKTEKKLEKLYLEERKKYARKNEITLSQLNRELKQIDSWNNLKEQIIKHYGQLV